MTVRAILIAAAFLALVAPAASAAEVSIRVSPSDGVRLGNATGIAGRVTERGAALAGRTVRLEVRKHPYRGRWKRAASRTTNAAGRYAFSRRFDRNRHVRVRLEGRPASDYTSTQRDTLSRRRNAYVLPAFTLTFAELGGTRIRLRQVYTVPKRVKLTAPTRFYVGPCRPDANDECTAERAPFRVAAKTRRVRRGRYLAQATVRIPAAFGGRFSYVSCFRYSKGSGMGDPGQTCPRRSVRLTG